jgi:hypothetical protein
MNRMPTVSREATKLSKQGMALPDPVRSVDDGGYSRANRKLDGMQTFGRVLSALGGDLEGFDKITASRWDKQDADYERQQMLEQRQRQRQEIVQRLGPEAAIAFDLNEKELGNRLSDRYGTNVLSQGQILDRGIDATDFNVAAPVYGNNDGVLFRQNGDGTVDETRLQQSYNDINIAAKTAEDVRNNNMINKRGMAEIGVSRDRLNFDMNEAERKAVNGDPEFTAAQNARIYSDSMDAADAAMKDQGRLDTIARTALQFVESAKDYNSQGEGWWNDLGQALSMDTTGLKQLTDTIAPLIREPGSGGNSDADVNMFKSSVVSINNPKEANVRFANGAQALAGRNKEYVSYLSDAIEPNDPKSRQNANRIWLAYAAENPLFDAKTGEVRTPPRFKDWLDVKTGNAPPVNSFLNRRVQATVGALAPSVQSQQSPPDIDPEDWKYFTPEMKQQYLAGRGQ